MHTLQYVISYILVLLFSEKCMQINRFTVPLTSLLVLGSSLSCLRIPSRTICPSLSPPAFFFLVNDGSCDRDCFTEETPAEVSERSGPGGA